MKYLDDISITSYLFGLLKSLIEFSHFRRYFQYCDWSIHSTFSPMIGSKITVLKKLINSLFLSTPGYTTLDDKFHIFGKLSSSRNTWCSFSFPLKFIATFFLSQSLLYLKRYKEQKIKWSLWSKVDKCLYIKYKIVNKLLTSCYIFYE